jgi:signal transduction histidine kinase
MNDMANVAMLSLRAEPGLPIVAAASGQARVLGYEPAALRGLPLAALCPARQPDGRDSAAALTELFGQLGGGGSSSGRWTFQARDGQLRLHELHLNLMEIDGQQRLAACLVDLGHLQVAEALDATRNELLEMVATGAPLRPVLERLTALIEAPFEDLFCTVLLLDLDGRHVRVGAGPRMPPAYMQALDGYEIGPAAGSCGTAMHDDRLVIVEDIATDPLWAPYKALILPHGFRACWSAPIHAASHGVIGSFAMYYRNVRGPSADELKALQVASHLAGIAIDQDRRDEERRRAAQWLEEQVQRRTTELLATQDELVNSRKLAALGLLLAGIAHEMNTPLGNALLAASALRANAAHLQARMADTVPLKRHELIDAVAQTASAAGLVEQNVSRALRLIGRFQQLTEGSSRALRERFKVRAAVQQAWARVQTRQRVGHVQLDCEVPEGLALNGYPEVLQQVLDQLFENACLHAFAGGRAGHIRVTGTRTDDRHLVLEIRDDGAGMSRAELDHAFEPFFTTAFGQGGCGLGLFVAHNMVSGMLGGSIQLDSRPGEGTVVRLELPLDDGPALRLAA